MADKNYKSFVGKRKEAVARLRLFVTGLPTVVGDAVKKGDILINGKKAEDYFKGIVAKATTKNRLKLPIR